MDRTFSRKLRLINNISKIDTFYIDAQDNHVATIINSEYSVLIEKDVDNAIKNLTQSFKKSKQANLIEYTSPLGFRYMALSIYEGKVYDGCVILGPTLLEVSDLSQNIALSPENQQLLDTFIKQIDFLSYHTYEAIRLFAFNTLSNPLAEPEIDHSSEDRSDIIETLSDEDVYYDTENFNRFLENSTAWESQLLHLVETGNIDQLVVFNQSVKSDDSLIYKKRGSISHIRNKKNLLIALNSIALRAAYRGGLPFFLGHHLSNTNAVVIEKTNNPVLLSGLQSKMLEEYCKYVNEYSYNAYSKLIKKAIDYIFINLSSPLQVTTIAEHLFTNASYLSRKFKQDTGLSITAFINKEKIKQAKTLIKEGTLTLTEIGSKSGYNSYTHFADVFKKQMNMTPREYKTKIINKQ